MEVEITSLPNKRKPLFSISSDDSSESSHLNNVSSRSIMGKPTRKKKARAFVANTVAQPKTKPKTSRQTNTNSPKTAVNVSNTYAVLTDNDDENIMNNSDSKKSKTVKIPPIICIDAKYNEMVALLKAAKIDSYSLKYISMGIKVFCTSLSDFESARNSLKNSKIQHFTHDVPSQKSQKFVLAGLPNFPIDEVKGALREMQIDVCDVKKMKTKFESENYALYLLYFNNSTVTLQSLRKIKYILNVAVSWKPYQQARNGPTQCNNCQLYGHGNKNCHLEPRCAKCAGKHQTIACLKHQQPQAEVPSILKCCLCGGLHSSKDRDCPKRMSYINMKLKQGQRPSNTQPRPQPAQSSPAFTSIQKTRSPAVMPNKKFSDWFKPPQQERVIVEPSDELLSNDLLSEMMIELFQGLRSSRTRLDQIQTVTSVVLKYSTISLHD